MLCIPAIGRSGYSTRMHTSSYNCCTHPLCIPSMFNLYLFKLFYLISVHQFLILLMRFYQDTCTDDKHFTSTQVLLQTDYSDPWYGAYISVISITLVELNSDTLVVWNKINSHFWTGVAGNLFRRGANLGVWGTEVHQWGPGLEAWCGSGGYPQKLKTYHIC